jgi:hypothetical protein
VGDCGTLWSLIAQKPAHIFVAYLTIHGLLCLILFISPAQHNKIGRAVSVSQDRI